MMMIDSPGGNLVKKTKKKWDNSNCWVLKNLGFHSKEDIFVQETDLIIERKSANLWKISLKRIWNIF